MLPDQLQPSSVEIGPHEVAGADASVAITEELVGFVYHASDPARELESFGPIARETSGFGLSLEKRSDGTLCLVHCRGDQFILDTPAEYIAQPVNIAVDD